VGSLAQTFALEAHTACSAASLPAKNGETGSTNDSAGAARTSRAVEAAWSKRRCACGNDTSPDLPDGTGFIQVCHSTNMSHAANPHACIPSATSVSHLILLCICIVLRARRQHTSSEHLDAMPKAC